MKQETGKMSEVEKAANKWLVEQTLAGCWLAPRAIDPISFLAFSMETYRAGAICALDKLLEKAQEASESTATQYEDYPVVMIADLKLIIKNLMEKE